MFVRREVEETSGWNNSVHSIVVCCNVQHGSKIIVMCCLRALFRYRSGDDGKQLNVWIWSSEEGSWLKTHHFQHWNNCKSLGNKVCSGGKKFSKGTCRNCKIFHRRKLTCKGGIREVGDSEESINPRSKGVSKLEKGRILKRLWEPSVLRDNSVHWSHHGIISEHA